jgi:hypothetical protein
MYKEINQGMK